jgi:hypothetical protein
MDAMTDHPSFKLFLNNIDSQNLDYLVVLLDQLIKDSPNDCTDIYLAWDDTVRLIMDEHVHLLIERRTTLLKLLTTAFIENNEDTMDDIRKDIIINHYHNPEPLTPEGEEWVRKILQLMYNLEV